MKYLIICFTLVALLFTSLFAAAPKEQTEVERESVVVIGGGIGGLTSALYLARSGLTPLVIEGTLPGGLLRQSHSVQNWPGEFEINGSSLIDKVRSQAQENGVQFLSEQVVSVDFSKAPFKIITEKSGGDGKREIQAAACIIAMGTQPNFLGIPGEAGEGGYWGRGVTNCAICDGSFYRDQVVGVVGGGDAAVVEALYLANIAKEVHLFVRKDKLKANETKRVESLLKLPNVKIFYDTEVTSVEGDGERVTGVVLKSKKKGTYTSPLNGLFLAIGSKPNSSLFTKSLKLDKSGYIVLKKDQQTSLEGVYAVGDIVDPVYKQAISAAGDGAKAAMQAQQFLSDRGFVQETKKADVTEEVKIEPSLVEINDVAQLEKELSRGDRLVVVDFYAPWCGPCKNIAPQLDSLADRLPSKVKVLKVNIDRFPNLCKTYNILSVPTLLVFNGEGKLIDRKAGMGEISQFLKQTESEFDIIAGL